MSPENFFAQNSYSKKIDSNMIGTVLDGDFPACSFTALGDVDYSGEHGALSYLKEKKYLSSLVSNPKISGVLCRQEDVHEIPDSLISLVVDDPNYSFFTLVDHCGGEYLSGIKSLIPSEHPVDRLRGVSQTGVYLGEGVLLEPNVTIHPGTYISDNVKIRAGAVLGLDTFQHQRTTKGIVSPKHDGYLIVEEGVEVGACATVSKGFSYRSTRLKKGCRLDAHVYVGHGAQVGVGTFLCAGSRVMGHVDIGEEVFIGPNAIVSSRCVIGDRAKVSLGSVVTKSVPESATVTGNFAIPHDQFISNLKGQLKSGGSSNES